MGEEDIISWRDTSILHIYTLTQTYMYIHTCSHACTHRHTCTYTPAHMHAHMQHATKISLSMQSSY